MTYDAVILGAGPSGLAAAARLCHFGLSVCLLEAHCRLGGLSSWHHVGGREISSGLHAFTNYLPGGRGGVLGKLLRQLRIKASDLDLRPQGTSSIRFPGATLRFSNDIELIREQVAAAFPASIDAFDRFRALVRQTDEGEVTRRQTSARAVLEAHIADPLLVDMLLCPVMFYGNPGGVGDGDDGGRQRPDMDWLLFCVVWKCIFESGFAYPAAGMRPLWEQLARRIAEDGGVIRMASPVAEFVVRDGRAVAARLASGEEIAGERFFSSAGAVETLELLGDPPAARPPVGFVSVVEGISLLERPAVSAGLEDTTVFYSFEDVFRFRRPDALTDAASGVICVPGNYDGVEESLIKVSNLASYPAWSALSPDAYRAAKREVAAGMTAALARLGTDLAALRDKPGKFGDWDDVFTPVTLKRFTGHADGALYGSPVKSRTGETPCPNVFLIGADQGFHGIVGAMLSGVAMVNMHLLAKRA